MSELFPAFHFVNVLWLDLSVFKILDIVDNLDTSW